MNDSLASHSAEPGTALAGEQNSNQPLVVPLDQLDRRALLLAGGKAANLGEMIRAGLPVPTGFCVTTAAYRLVAQAAQIDALLLGASATSSDGEAGDLGRLSDDARAALLSTPMPEAVAAAILAAYRDLHDSQAMAVRSSATAEDLPEASFAGQQDTYLDVVGEEALVDAVRRCWASLWTERAVAYRAANRIDQRAVQLAVVVQQMVPAASAGVLFTADPLTGQRQIAVIDAAPGLGEAVVSGSINPDHIVVDTRTGRIVERRIGATAEPKGEGRDQRTGACLTDAQVLELARLGERVEAHYGAPQDLEWAYDPAGKLWLLQARPITTLYPLPGGARADDDRLSIYFSVNVAQGVLGPLTPMGIASLRRIAAAVARLLGFKIRSPDDQAVLVEAGGRLFIDVSPPLRNPVGRRILLAALGIAEAQSGQIIRGLLDDPHLAPRSGRLPGSALLVMGRILVRTRLPVRVLRALVRPVAAREAALLAVEQACRESGTPGSALAALNEVERLLDRLPRLLVRLAPLVLGGLASLGLARKLAEGLGVGDEALLVTRGLAHNPTTEMDLVLWDLASRLRQDQQASTLLATVSPPELSARYLGGELPAELRDGVAGFLERYGFRGVAEIDVGLPRWRDDPAHVFGVLSNYQLVSDPERAPDAAFRRGADEAQAATVRTIRRAGRRGLTGRLAAPALRFLFGRVRDLAGLRELPKFAAIRILGRCRQLLKGIGHELEGLGRLDHADDVFFLSLAEARRALGGEDVRAKVAAAREQYNREQRRRLVPRVLLSDGRAFYGGAEASSGPAAEPGSLVGTPASPGVYSGRARVILDPSGARIEPGEILIAPSTDPGWTPLFLTAGALVMEMGGMMSHGSVVAREYGIPAVVGLVGATTAIATGQRITVDGSRGKVIMVDDSAPPSGA